MDAKVLHVSPWLYGLERTRDELSLTKSEKADVAIIGGGIAGVATAYFLLTRTNRSVTIIEKLRIAEGATGNNAGTATPIFEKPLAEFIELFGSERVKEGLNAIDDGWELLDEFYEFAEGMALPLHVNGYFGYRSVEEVVPILSENAIRISLDAPPREVFFAEEKRESLIGPLASMPGLRFISAAEIAKHLRTPDTRFVAAVSEHEALINTASLCEKAVAQLQKQFKDRFTVFENTEVTAVGALDGVIECREGTVHAQDIILATNGFEKFTLKDEKGSDLDKKFHRNITSRLGYMIGIFFPNKKPEVASLAYVHSERISHVAQENDFGMSFVYVTERPYVKDGVEGTLLAIGDPDSEFNHERADYSKDVPFNRGVQTEMERFLELHYDIHTDDHERFLWHGLMGYTKKYARLVGTDIHHPKIHYNLGCNGVGILLSLWGGRRLSQIVLGEKLPATMFDPDAHFSDNL